MAGRNYDEYADNGRFDRPRRHTRPRTKDRPTYDDALAAMVVTVDRGRFTCLLDRPDDDTGGGGGNTGGYDTTGDRLVMAMKSRPLGRKGVVVGDRVRLVGDISGADGSLARIVEVVERRTVLRRTADDDDPVERVVVANADQLVVVAALAEPEPRPRLIDRALVAAYDAGLDPLLCLTKPDLQDPETLLSIYRPLGVPYVVTQDGVELSDIRARLEGRISVLVGHSGVGKSTLVNGLVPGTDRAIGQVNTHTGRGRHTSTSALMLRLPDTGQARGGWIVDTPGIRSFGLAHVDPRELIGAFPDLAELTGGCPRGCSHGRSEPECALDDAVARGLTESPRVESFRRLLESRERAEED